MRGLRTVPMVARRHPFVVRLDRYMALSDADLQRLSELVEAEHTLNKRQDLVVDGYEYRDRKSVV